MSELPATGPAGPPSRILLLCGSLRAASVNAAVLRTAAAVAPPGVVAVPCEVMARLPHFNPDDDVDLPPAAVAELRRELRDADAVLICTPEYAGSLPGAFKNLLDWTVGGTEMDQRPVGWVNVAARHRGAEGAHAQLRTVLGYVNARIAEDACRRVPVGRELIDAGGLIADPGVRAALAGLLGTLAAAARGSG